MAAKNRSSFHHAPHLDALRAAHRLPVAITTIMTLRRQTGPQIEPMRRTALADIAVITGWLDTLPKPPELD